MRFGMVWLKSHRPPQGGRGLVPVCLLAEGEAEIVVRVREVRVEAQSLLVMGNRLLDPVEGRKFSTQVVMGLGNLRVEFHGLLITGQRVVPPAQSKKDIAQIDVSFGIVRPEPYCL